MQRQGFAPYFYGVAKRWATRGDGSVSAEGVYRFDVGLDRKLANCCHF